MINEVIETLKAYTDGKDNAGKVEISVMQLNRIIKALDQEPTDAVDRVTIKEYLESFGKDTNATTIDAVDRQAVLDQTYLWSKDEFLRVTNPFDYLRKRINSLPPVTPLPKVGRWIKHDTGHSIYYDCSLCNCVAPCTETADKILWKMANYCPDCGAKMQEVKDEKGNNILH